MGRGECKNLITISPHLSVNLKMAKCSLPPSIQPSNEFLFSTRSTQRTLRTRASKAGRAASAFLLKYSESKGAAVQTPGVCSRHRKELPQPGDCMKYLVAFLSVEQIWHSTLWEPCFLSSVGFLSPPKTPLGRQSIIFVLGYRSSRFRTDPSPPPHFLHSIKNHK